MFIFVGCRTENRESESSRSEVTRLDQNPSAKWWSMSTPSGSSSPLVNECNAGLAWLFTNPSRLIGASVSGKGASLRCRVRLDM